MFVCPKSAPTRTLEVSCLANGPDVLLDLLRASERDTLDGEEVGTREGNSTYTMNFTGHRVRVELADRGCA